MEKKRYYSNINLNNILDGKTFWKTIKPLFSEKVKSRNKITLIEGDQIIDKDAEIAQLMNDFFSKAVEKLNIKGYETPLETDNSLDSINNALLIISTHPSIIKIKENIVKITFSFTTSSEIEISNKIRKLNSNKATTFNSIPEKIT